MGEGEGKRKGKGEEEEMKKGGKIEKVVPTQFIIWLEGERAGKEKKTKNAAYYNPLYRFSFNGHRRKFCRRK